MSFWSSEKLKDKQKKIDLIHPYDEERVKHGAYELSLGYESFITSDSNKKVSNHKEHIIIPSGQFALLLTKEKVFVPPDSIGFISMKAGKKIRGLINVSGFHVDPGFDGFLKFSVYNAGSQNIVLSCGDPLFLIWFSDLDQITEDIYDGDHAGQCEISSNDIMNIQGDIASPAALNKRLLKVEYSIHLSKVILVAGLLALLVAVSSGLIVKFIGDWTNTQDSITQDQNNLISKNNNDK